MRRALGLVTLVALGVLIGFLLRLVLPRRDRAAAAVYDPAAVGLHGS
jgi:hypothetical protein